MDKTTISCVIYAADQKWSLEASTDFDIVQVALAKCCSLVQKGYAHVLQTVKIKIL